MAGAGLDNVNILSTDRVLDLASALTAREFGEDAVAGRDAKDVANAIRQLRMGVTAEQDNVANHVLSIGLTWKVQAVSNVGAVIWSIEPGATVEDGAETLLAKQALAAAIGLFLSRERSRDD
jgi:hypothetical protein